MHSFRRALLGFLPVLAVASGSCNRSPPPPGVLGRLDPAPVFATFEGRVDRSTGEISIRTIPVTTPGALAVWQPWQDGAAGSGPENTLELVTERVSQNDPGGVVDGCAPGDDAFEASITVRSFLRNQAFSDVWIELTSLTPAGNEGCNDSDPGTTGLSTTYGLWHYGPLGLAGTGTDHATVRWKFHDPRSETFTFTGRIMANVDPPQALVGGAEFDWTPTSIVRPTASFKEVGTTLSHVVWNGAGFVDLVGGLTFTEQATGAGDHPVGLWDPAERYGGPFTADWFLGTAGTFDTSGDFTVCVKFKPGHSANGDPNLILVGKGHAEATEGWAVMQMNGEYCFHYRTAADVALGRTQTMAYTGPGPNAFDATYDYHCGGRDGAQIRSAAHGWDHNTVTDITTVNGTFADAAALPITIGAYSNGDNLAQDAGVYEFIIDSRPATWENMREIVADAESWRLPGSTGAAATYAPSNTAQTTSYVGADGGLYTLPPYASIPLATDWSGLLAEGAEVDYTHPLNEDTTTTGFCIGVEVTANGAWANVGGGVVTLVDDFRVGLNPLILFMNNGHVQDDWSVESAWAAGSTHTLEACASAAGATALYADGSVTPLATGSTGGLPISNLGTGSFRIGYGAFLTPTNLTGGRIRRVFACPDPDPANCN